MKWLNLDDEDTLDALDIVFIVIICLALSLLGTCGR